MANTQGSYALAAVSATASHPAVAVWFALGAVALAAAVVAMAWSVHAQQIRLAEFMARRQFLVIAGTGNTAQALDEAGRPGVADEELGGDARARLAPPAAIDGPDNVVTGEQARYRILPALEALFSQLKPVIRLPPWRWTLAPAKMLSLTPVDFRRDRVQVVRGVHRERDRLAKQRKRGDEQRRQDAESGEHPLKCRKSRAKSTPA